MIAPAPAKVAIFISFSGEGGVERMVLNLAGGLLDAGFCVDLVLVKAQGKHVHDIPDGARVFNLNARHNLYSLPGLIRYLRSERPTVLLAAKHRAIKTAVLARGISGVHVRLVGRLGTTLSAALVGKSALQRWFWYTSMRLFYKHVDQIVAVSEGVAEDVMNITGLPKNRVSVVRNPVWTPDLERRAAEPVEHSWFSNHDFPIILGAGRLTRQKDFATLIRAFALVRQKRRCGLAILGSGKLQPELAGLAEQLGVGGDVLFTGFVANPAAYMARADLFVLSSVWEGSPNVLTEALAVGTPVVSTDCPSGPKEILDHGRYGKLVPMGDPEAMAQAIEDTLNNTLPRATLQQAAEPYKVAASTAGYMMALGLEKRQ